MSTLNEPKSSAMVARSGFGQRVLALVALAVLFAAPVLAQYTPPPPPPPPENQGPAPEASAPAPVLSPEQLDDLVARIALYPDPLLAQTLTASTYWNEIADAAAWANQHSYLHGQALAQAIQEDNLPWDSSVLALLPFPSTLNMMAQDMGWTQQLGTAVLNQRPDVMDAVQRMRQKAYDYGYLRSTPYYVVANQGGYIDITPVNPSYIYVPAYDPALVYVRPRPGFVIGAIRFGPAIVVGAPFAPWGWAGPHFVWGQHAIIIDRTPWNRSWANRSYYRHPYERRWEPRPGPRVERHDTHDSREPHRH
jgi:hypothetical protein